MAVNIGVNIQRSANRIAQAVRESGVGGKYPELLLDFDDGYYRANGGSKPLSEVVTHSRAGNATMVASDGLIKWAPHNLVTYSEQFDNAAWTKTDTTVTTNTVIAPDGTLTGDHLAAGIISAYHGVTQTTSDSDNRTFSVFAKAAEYAFVRLGNSGKHQSFNLSTGQLGSINTGVVSSIEHFGNGWYRCTVSFSDNVGINNYISFAGTDIDTQYTGDGTSGIYLWGAHLYRSDLGGMAPVPAGERSFPGASTYVPTTSAARYLPRVGHHVYNGSAWVNEGVLAESEARTNLFTYSEDFTQWDNIETTNSVSSTVAAPDGSFATEIFETAANDEHFIRDNSLTLSAQVYTHSCFVKYNGRHIQIRTAGEGNGFAFANFDLLNGVVGNSGGSNLQSATIESYGDGWYRCSISVLHTASGTGVLIVNCKSPLTDGEVLATSDLTYTGDITKGFYIYGAQLEAAPTPSSYIPTAGSTVTRAAETFLIPAANLPWPTETYGPELVTNGTFDSDTSGWYATSAGSISHDGVNNAVIVSAGSSDAYAGCEQVITVEAGKTYLATGDILSFTGTDVAFAVGLQSNFSQVFNANYTGNSFSAVFTAPQSTLYIRLGTRRTPAGASHSATFDNISVRELTRYPVSIQMNGRLTYADEGSAGQVTYTQWEDDANNRITLSLDTDSTATGEVNFTQVEGGTADTVASSATEYAPGILVPFNIASRHGATFINGAVDGVALTANTTPTNLPDLSATDLDLAYDYMGTVERFRVWGLDLGDGGIEDATTGEPASYLIWDQANDDYVQRIFQ